MSGPEARVWYVAYGSNLDRARFGVYLRGGRPVGGARVYPGCRDPSDPLGDEPVMLPGGIRFVAESLVWGGGLAVYDDAAGGEVAARAYLVRQEQFLDVLAQEMRLEPGLAVDLEPVHRTGRHTLGPQRYQTLTRVGVRDDVPMLTFTCADVAAEPLTAPSEGYLRTIAAGLRVAHGWSEQRIGAYLAACPGAAGTWTAAAVADLAAGGITR